MKTLFNSLTQMILNLLGNIFCFLGSKMDVSCSFAPGLRITDSHILSSKCVVAERIHGAQGKIISGAL